jgi:DNA-binding CsgD family transcriptional regulator
MSAAEPPVNGDFVIESVTREISEQLAASRVVSEAVVEAVLATLSEQIPGLWVLVLMKRDPATSRVFAADRRQPELASYVDSYVSSLYSPGVAETSGLSQQVIESGVAFARKGMTPDQFMPLMTPRGQEYLQEHAAPVATESVTAIMVPMRTFGATVGTLAVFQFDASDGLGEDDVGWLQRVADRTALGAEYAELHKIADQREARLAAISAATGMIASARELRPALEVILEQIRGKLEVDAADVLVVDAAAHELVTVSSAGFHSTSAPANRFPVPQQIPQSGSVELDMIDQSRRRSLFAREGFHAYRFVPLRLESKLVGALELFHRSPLHLDPEDTAFLDAMSSLTAVALQRSTQGASGQRRAADMTPKPIFTRRDLEILKLLVAGHTNQGIAEELHLSQNTVKFHVRELLDKTHASNRTELASMVTENGWLDR